MPSVLACAFLKSEFPTRELELRHPFDQLIRPTCARGLNYHRGFHGLCKAERSLPGGRALWKKRWPWGKLHAGGPGPIEVHCIQRSIELAGTDGSALHLEGCALAGQLLGLKGGALGTCCLASAAVRLEAISASSAYLTFFKTLLPGISIMVGATELH